LIPTTLDAIRGQNSSPPIGGERYQKVLKVLLASFLNGLFAINVVVGVEPTEAMEFEIKLTKLPYMDVLMNLMTESTCLIR
jgi:hypothetical protein